MNTKKYSNYQEKRIAKVLNGRKQPNSGATAFLQGDVITENFLVEAKTQVEKKASFTIKEEWIEKNREEAFALKKPYSTIAFNFGGERNKKNYYVIDENLMLILCEHLKTLV